MTERYTPSARILELLETFRLMVNDSMTIGLKNDIATQKTLPSLVQGTLKVRLSVVLQTVCHVESVRNTGCEGLLRFSSSLSERTKGEAGEAVKGNAEHEGKPLILRVDASKLIHGREPMSHKNLEAPAV